MVEYEQVWSFPVLWEIDRQNFNMMYEMSTRIVVQKEEALFIQGQPTTYIYLIERGYFGVSDFDG